MAFLTAWVFLALAGATAASVDPEWEQFKAKYRKTYVSDEDEQERYKLFKTSLVRIASLNALNGHVAFGINWHADRFPHEKNQRGHKTPAGFIPTAPVMNFTDLRSPPSIDWRRTRAVTPIKNQGHCGSCWAFSATEAIESQVILATGFKTAMSLSPQQITSCTPNTREFAGSGCDGGYPEGAYDYLKSVTGLANSFYIPYEESLTGTNQVVGAQPKMDPTKPCPVEKVQQIGASPATGGWAEVTGYSYVTPPCFEGACQNQDLRRLAAALEKTPVSICLNANASVWDHYVGGVVTAKACGSMAADAINHCVMATGFNTTAETPYWIVRNSWASTWGEAGYIYLEMAENTCGVANRVTIPHVKGWAHPAFSYEEADAAAWREAAYQLATQGTPAI